MDSLFTDPKYKRWAWLAEKWLLLLVIVGFGIMVGYMVGVQGSDARVAAADARLVAERTDRLEEIKRLQEANAIALAATARLTERVARRSERTAEKVDAAAEKAEVAAASAKGAAARAVRSAPSAPAVNETVRDANRQLKEKR